MAIEPSLEQALHEILARNQIHDALMRYCRGVDRLDRALILSAYHPGARDNHGSFDGPAEEFAEWVIERHTNNIVSCTHFVGNVLIQLDGDTAQCESYVIAFHRVPVNGVLQDLMGFGRYVDRFELRNGAWKIADRYVIFDKDRLEPVAGQWDGPLTQALIKGRRDGEDASYRAIKTAIAIS